MGRDEQTIADTWNRFDIVVLRVPRVQLLSKLRNVFVEIRFLYGNSRPQRLKEAVLIHHFAAGVDEGAKRFEAAPVHVEIGGSVRDPSALIVDDERPEREPFSIGRGWHMLI